ncbi:hypothetical protein [Dyadobacter sp. 676]|uniref:Uncharacterized protein n=1 Tax=Dyadobacter sp. 676 TaxID=3088362 RepID=A0AAU8FKH8_9BACT
MIDPKDVQGIGNDLPVISENIKGTFSDEGLISATGTMYSAALWKLNVISATITPELGTYIFLHREKFSWLDILAFSMAISSKAINKYTGKAGYVVGKRFLDKISLVLISKEIAEGEDGKDWNAIFAEKAKVDPLIDDTSQPNSPFNSNSPYYEPDKPIFTYDPDNGLIIYKSGLIVWTGTDKEYYDPDNGQAVSYDKYKSLIYFSSGAILNFDTLELTRPDGQVETVTNDPKWYVKYKLVLIATSVLIVLIMIVKRRRNGK